MLRLQPVNDFIYVELNDKIRKKTGDSPFTTIITSNNEGTVKYSSSEQFPVGSVIRFGGDHQRENVDGADLLVMSISNIRAKVLE
jgi:hypothetical protein